VKKVTLADTGETVTLVDINQAAPQPSPTGEGYGWIDATDEEGDFHVLSLWGRDGWDLGCWPYIVFAAMTHTTTEGKNVYGYATYVEGDLAAHWYADIRECYLAISREAWWYWCSGQSDGPATLRGRDPNKFEEIDGLCEPFVGFPC
jgi:hypothetical protein